MEIPLSLTLEENWSDNCMGFHLSLVRGLGGLLPRMEGVTRRVTSWASPCLYCLYSWGRSLSWG